MKIFSPSLKRQLQACILAIFWPKKDIYKFFKDCSVPLSVLKIVEGWEAKNLTRRAIVDEVFNSLGNQADNGTMHFTLMLEALSDWSYFDEYWFTQEQKLDIEDAKKKIAALRSAKTSHIDQAKRRADDRRAKTKAQEARHMSMDEMRQDFQTVCNTSETPQARGYAFEKFLVKMARYFDLQVTEAFKIKGTQIDGTVKFDGENYNIEAKWERQWISDEPLFAFCHKLLINMHGRGIFISVNGYSPGALSLLERNGVKNAVLMDGEDITLILHEMVTLPQALDQKIHAAQTRGQFYIHPITGQSKISQQ
jgi:hypothetical protein